MKLNNAVDVAEEGAHVAVAGVAVLVAGKLGAQETSLVFQEMMTCSREKASLVVDMKEYRQYYCFHYT